MQKRGSHLKDYIVLAVILILLIMFFMSFSRDAITGGITKQEDEIEQAFISVPFVQEDVGRTVNIPLNIRTTKEVCGVVLDLYYDPDVLSATKITQGDALRGWVYVDGIVENLNTDYYFIDRRYVSDRYFKGNKVSRATVAGITLDRMFSGDKTLFSVDFHINNNIKKETKLIPIIKQIIDCGEKPKELYREVRSGWFRVKDRPNPINNPIVVINVKDTDDFKVPLTATFTGETFYLNKEGILFSWDFDNSNGIQTDALGETVTYVYNRPGIYTATLTVRDRQGKIARDTVTIVAKPVANIYTTLGQALDPLFSNPATQPPQPPIGPTPLSVFFYGFEYGGNTRRNYFWDFGDGSSSNEKDTQHTYIRPGTYLAKFTITDIDGNSASDAVKVNVLSTKQPISTSTSCSSLGGNSGYEGCHFTCRGLTSISQGDTYCNQKYFSSAPFCCRAQ